jgi:hypothetical protein
LIDIGDEKIIIRKAGVNREIVENEPWDDQQ